MLIKYIFIQSVAGMGDNEQYIYSNGNERRR